MNNLQSESQKKLREAMGKYNNLDVRKNFNVDTIAKDYVTTLAAAVKRGQTSTVDVSTRADKTGASRWIAKQPEMLTA